MSRSRSYPQLALAVMAAALVTAAPAQAAPDEGKRECLQDAKTLCAKEMRSFSRKKVQVCLIAKIAQTSPMCHATMLKLKAEHDAAVVGKHKAAPIKP